MHRRFLFLKGHLASAEKLCGHLDRVEIEVRRIGGGQSELQAEHVRDSTGGRGCRACRVPAYLCDNELNHCARRQEARSVGAPGPDVSKRMDNSVRRLSGL